MVKDDNIGIILYLDGNQKRKGMTYWALLLGGEYVQFYGQY